MVIVNSEVFHKMYFIWEKIPNTFHVILNVNSEDLYGDNFKLCILLLYYRMFDVYCIVM